MSGAKQGSRQWYELRGFSKREAKIGACWWKSKQGSKKAKKLLDKHLKNLRVQYEKRNA